MKGAIAYLKHYSILQNMMMDEVCKQISKDTHFINLEEKPDVVEKELDELDVDYLVVWYFWDKLNKLKPLDRLGIPIIMTSDDPWGRLFSPNFRNIVEYHNIDGIILQTNGTKEAFIEYLGEDKDFFWLPWGINPDIMKDYKENKIWDFSISGKFSTYEWRRLLHSKLVSNPRYHRIPRVLPPSRSWIDYARDLNKSYISLGGCSQENSKKYYKNYFICETFAKTLEIPACNTCLMNTDFADREELGFEDGINFIQFNNEREFNTKMDYYLDDKDELKKVTTNGYDLVQKNYTTEQQVRKLVKEIERVYG